MVQQLCYQAGPAGLMAGSNAAAVIAVKVLIKEDMVSKVGIILHLVILAKDGPRTVAVPQKDVRQSSGKFL